MFFVWGVVLFVKLWFDQVELCDSIVGFNSLFFKFFDPFYRVILCAYETRYSCIRIYGIYCKELKGPRRELKIKKRKDNG